MTTDKGLLIVISTKKKYAYAAIMAYVAYVETIKITLGTKRI